MDEEAPLAEVIPTSGSEPLSAREAANSLSQYRYKRDAGEERQAQAAPEGEAEQESAKADAAPEKDTGETQATDQAEEAPASETSPLGLPRSWAKDKADIWAKLDPDTQAYLLEQDSTSSKAVRRTQNEVAEQRKAIEAERTTLEQARQQYEQALPVLLQTLQQQQQGEFADIKSMDDVTKLAREDWPRYALWDAQQKKIAAVQNELRVNQERQSKDYQQKWEKFATDEDAKFLDAAPEMSDKTKAAKITSDAFDLLKDLGFTQDELNRSWNGQASWSPRDSRVQLLIRDAVRYREAQAALKKAPKAVPQVQRPGSSNQRAPDQSVQLQSLSNKLDQSGSVKDALAYIVAQRAARR